MSTTTAGTDRVRVGVEAAPAGTPWAVVLRLTEGARQERVGLSRTDGQWLIARLRAVLDPLAVPADGEGAQA